MPNKSLLTLAIALVTSVLSLSATAEYLIKIPVDATSIVMAEGSTEQPTQPTEPTTPTEPVEDKSITLTSNHQTLLDNTGNYIVSLYKSAGDAQPFAQQLRWPLNSQFDTFSVVAPDDDSFNNATKLQINGVECVIQTHTEANRTFGCNAGIVSKTSVGSTIVVKIIK
ncbi:hypothetical protein [Pseudomonas baetica]|nr:hypothetical protein [Pseudomonas baetica]